MDAAVLLHDTWGYFVVAAPGCWAMWKQFNRADLIRVAQEAATGVIHSLEERIKTLEGELSELRKEHSDTIASKDAELALLRGRLRQALSIIEAQERVLEANNIPHEKPSQPFWLVEASELTPL